MSSKEQITTIILSKTEAVNPLILESVDFSDEIIVLVGTEKTGPTSCGKIKYLYHPLNRDFSSHRNYAISKIKTEWILFVDDDEIISSELAREIKSVVGKSDRNGYYIKRTDIVFHQPLLHGETGNTSILRLARASKGKFFRKVHETWNIKGKMGQLNAPIYHLKSSFVSEFLPRMAYYSQIDCHELTNEKKPFSIFRTVFNPVAKFIQNYFLKLGFLDGQVGLFISYLMSVQSLSVRVFQWQNRTGSQTS